MPRQTRSERHAALARASELAGASHGQLSFAELTGCGVDRHRRKRLIEAGHLHRRPGRVVAVGHVGSSAHALAMAAVRAGGPQALLAGEAAAALLTDRPTMPARIAVAVRGDRRTTDPGLRFHRTAIADDERDEHFGIPVTRPERTALDCARLLTEPELVRLTNELVVAHRTSVERLVAYARAHRGVKGVVALRGVLDVAADGITRSGAEDELGRVLRAAALDGFRLNAQVLGRERDVVFDAERVVVEVQSGRFHGTPAALEEDVRRALELRRAGWEPVAVTARMVADEPLRALAAVVSVVAPRRSAG